MNKSEIKSVCSNKKFMDNLKLQMIQEIRDGFYWNILPKTKIKKLLESQDFLNVLEIQWQWDDYGICFHLGIDQSYESSLPDEGFNFLLNYHVPEEVLTEVCKYMEAGKVLRTVQVKGRTILIPLGKPKFTGFMFMRDLQDIGGEK